jgi:hypothetical protein
MGPRRPGSAAGHENERFLEAELRRLGLENVRAEPIPIVHWAATEHQLEVGEAGDAGALEPLEAFPIPYTQFTPLAGLEAPLVWAEPTRLWHRADWQGRIVVTEIGFPDLDVGMLLKVARGAYDPHDTARQMKHPATWVRLGWHLYHLAARRGAAGFIGIVRDQPGGTCRMYAPYGFKEADIMAKPLPGFWVGKGDGPALRRLAESGRGRARLQVSGVREPGQTHNVVGEIPGQTDECVVLSCHHDSPFVSPVEDGSGVAVVLALARHLAEQGGLRRRVIVLLTAGHFYGSIGTRTFIKEHPDIVRRTALEISIEHIAHEADEGPTGQLVPTGLPEATGIFVPFSQAVTDAVLESVAAHDLDRVVLLPAEGPLGPYPPTDGGDWWEAGVPVVNHISNPVYLLTDDDALEWVDRERLPRVAAAFAEIMTRLDAVDRDAIARVDAPIYRLAMKLLRRVTYAKTTRFGLHPVY